MDQINEDKRISWILVVCLILYYNVDGVISYLLALTFIAIYILNYHSVISPRFFSPIFGMILLGIVSGIVGNHINTDYIRDLYYFSQPILYIYLGYVIQREHGNRYDFLLSIVVAASVLSVIYMFNVIQNPSVIFQSENIRDIRDEVGKETFIAMLGVILLLTQDLRIEKWKKNVMLLANVSVFVLQFSRASIGSIGVFFLVYYLMQDYKLDLHLIRNIVLGVLCVIVIFIVLPNSLTNDFIERLMKSATEISPSASTTWTRNEAYTNWRGYEIHLVLQDFKNGTLFQQIFGFGFGNRTSLGNGIRLGGLTSIPVFHNGYIQVLNKIGILGMILLFLFYYRAVRFALEVKNSCEDIAIQKLSKCVIALTFGVIFYSYFKGGIFKGTSIMEYLIIFGFLWAKFDRVTCEPELGGGVYEQKY